MKRIVVSFCAYFPDGKFKKFSFEEETELCCIDELQASKFRELEQEFFGSLLITRVVKFKEEEKLIDSQMRYAPTLILPNGKHVSCVESLL